MGIFTSIAQIRKALRHDLEGFLHEEIIDNEVEFHKTTPACFTVKEIFLNKAYDTCDGDAVANINVYPVWDEEDDETIWEYEIND